MSKIILFSNIKGGVGKTTLCAHFAEYLSMKGVPVVAVDADIQASLSRHREREVEADPGQTVPWRNCSKPPCSPHIRWQCIL